MPNKPINHSPSLYGMWGTLKHVPLPTIHATRHLQTNLYVSSLPESRALQLTHKASLWASTRADSHPELCMSSLLPQAQEMGYEQSWAGYSQVPAVPLGSVNMCHLSRVAMVIRASQIEQLQEQGLPGPQSRRRKGIEAAAESMVVCRCVGLR